MVRDGNGTRYPNFVMVGLRHWYPVTLVRHDVWMGPYGTTIQVSRHMICVETRVTFMRICAIMTGYHGIEGEA